MTLYILVDQRLLDMKPTLSGRNLDCSVRGRAKVDQRRGGFLLQTYVGRVQEVSLELLTTRFRRSESVPSFNNSVCSCL